MAEPRNGAAAVPIGHFVPAATYQVSGAVAEIVDANYLIYTDSEELEVGVVDISNPRNPTEVLTIGVGGQATNESRPRFVQVLGTGKRPEGLLAIPQRGLFITANDTISIFEGRPGKP